MPKSTLLYTDNKDINFAKDIKDFERKCLMLLL